MKLYFVFLQLQQQTQASKQPRAPTVIAFLPNAFTVVPFAKLNFPHRSAPYQRKIAVFLQE